MSLPTCCLLVSSAGVQDPWGQAERNGESVLEQERSLYCELPFRHTHPCLATPCLPHLTDTSETLGKLISLFSSILITTIKTSMIQCAFKQKCWGQVRCMNSGSQCDSRPCGKETLDRHTGRMPMKMGQRAGQQLFKQRNAESCQQIPRSQGQAAADPLMASGEQHRSVTETTAQRQ